MAFSVNDVAAKAAAEAQARGLGAYLIVLRRPDGSIVQVGDEEALNREMTAGATYVTVAVDAKGGAR
ncbi:MAG: hypothetical protein N2595_07865 [bacterium]|nr:hypothetical protein [bacterium]